MAAGESSGWSPRRDRLKQRLAEAGCEGLLVTGLANVRYLCGFTGSSAALLVLEGGDVLVTDGRYRTQVADEVDPGIEALIVREKLLKSTLVAARDRGIGRLAFERTHMTVAEWEAWREEGSPEPVGVEGWVEALRAIKSPDEIEAIRRAGDIAARAFAGVLERIRAGVEERVLALELDRLLIEAGSERPAFETIVAFGERSALPHARPTRRELARGELVLLDFGAVVEGYHSDMTRTVSYGPPPAELAAVYEAVLAGQRAAIAGLSAGMTGAEADSLAREEIARSGHGDRFDHSLGHGLGLEVHELPRLARASEDLLEPHMVVTIEPGVYIPRIGGVRVEDDVVVGAHGVEVLTAAAPKDDLITL